MWFASAFGLTVASLPGEQGLLDKEAACDRGEDPQALWRWFASAFGLTVASLPGEQNLFDKEAACDRGENTASLWTT